ncbi:MAG: DUF1593 domain-containing protein [Akkermansiaceae bacterium]|nr:DUF1593 domain-containing protein [Akkermansiaceae bacterium]
MRSNFQTYCYGGPDHQNLGPHTWKPYAYSPEGQNEWAEENVRSDHGTFGKLYPARFDIGRMHFIEGGGTIPWMGLVSRGLTNSSEPSWGGWSGRFSAEKLENVWSRHPEVKSDEQAFLPFALHTEVSDRWKDPEDGKLYDSLSAPIWRWRKAMWNDFKARMDWCHQPYAKANHPPHAVLNGDHSNSILKLTAKPGELMKFAANGSTDPDGNGLRYAWWNYPEVGRKPYGRSLEISNSSTPEISFTIPQDAVSKELHLILEVSDDSSIVSLVDYRRAVISIEQTSEKTHQ